MEVGGAARGDDFTGDGLLIATNDDAATDVPHSIQNLTLQGNSYPHSIQNFGSWEGFYEAYSVMIYKAKEEYVHKELTVTASSRGSGTLA